ncbi:serine phosphatase RsbU (regulator of sigma subunit)/PAS domain-containing protein [Streptomyces griseochromogenes]|uniref:Protein phosphatase n=1 Tax=Streptomyces griseochromogenes TaxID=68214 RepID=A0A1B1AXH0_9ACTN|nr:SpoIIE family protein phosphatase [Streptomyces griseochromogenes]ANP51245.1 protein phosphatase [Streptomyces griseochromogenes]MBP2050070.1 serine phosphatase RsbU (regulator of sigma subunit)/PAS domain-containing protein [Streptomyces griseochromogenes]
MTSETARPADPGTGADPAALAKAVARQRAELERLRETAAISAVLERAKGVLMATIGCSPDAAHHELLRRSETGNRTLVEECRLTLDSLAPSRQDPGTALAGAARPPAAGTREGAPAGTDDLADVLGRVGRDLVRVGSPQELAGCLLEHLRPEAGADAVLLYERLPEGALKLAGHAGADTTLAAQWHQVPPLPGLAPIDALTLGEPLWLEDPATDRRRHRLIGDPSERWPSRAWLPVPGADGAGFALGVMRRWEGPFGPRERDLLQAVARLSAGRLRTFDAPPEHPGAGTAQTVQGVFDALPGAAVALTPLRTASGEVADYRIDAATPGAVDVFGRTGRDMVGRHVLESCPSFAGEPLWHGYLDALASGAPFESEPFVHQNVAEGVPVSGTYSVRAAPLGDGLLVTWLRQEPAGRQEQRLADVQRLGNLAWVHWNLAAQEIDWSAQAYAILGRDPARGPVRLERLPELVLPPDADVVAHAIAELLQHALPFDVPFRVQAPDGVRHLRIVAQAVTEPDGTPAEVHGFVQDLTAQRSAELALVESERAILLQRDILQAERALAARLQHALLPLPSTPVRLAGLRVDVAYLPSQSGIHVGGDWFSAIELPDGAALFVVGDVAGHGLGAVATMAQLRFTAKGMLSTGSSLTGALARLNQLLLHSRDSQSTATMVLARYDPATHVLVWAQAGHPPPLLVRRGEVRFPDRPGGILLGASTNPVFESAEIRLEPGDRLLMYTDGLVERPGEVIDVGFTRLGEAVRAGGLGGAGSLQALLTMMLADERRDDVCVLDIRMPLEEEQPDR